MTADFSDLPDPGDMTLAECAEWVRRLWWAFDSRDERGAFAQQLGKRIEVLARSRCSDSAPAQEVAS